MNKIIAIALAMFFVLSITSVVVAAEVSGSYRGEVQAIDNHWLIVRPFHPSIAPVPGNTGGFMFRIDKATSVFKCNGGNELSAIKAGDMVNVTYKETAEIYVAQDINDTTCS